MNHFPACFIELPAETKGRRAAFYLAAEEWIATNLPVDSYLFTWQVGPTVVMGRNQVAHQEVDIDFCRRNGIDIIRRKSGGGAIFADEGNIMISLITESGKVEPLFAEYAETVAGGLRSLGADVEVRGRNDIILVPGSRSQVYSHSSSPKRSGKVCGNAFYHLADRNIVHGTMLYETNPVLMSGALKPLPQKLYPKGVQSIRARVGVLKESINLSSSPFGESTEGLSSSLRNFLTDRSITLDASAVKEIEQMEQAYYSEDFLYGSSARDEEVRGGRIEDCGTVEIHFHLKGSIIRNVHLTGDFFGLGDADQAFNKALKGVQFTDDSIAEAIRLHHPETTIRNLTSEALQSAILQI